ncbi:MAG: ABC transporter transmembrane domain-containing protein, partial [Actinobacteria bacterium]|nr:ABC transporter transmembrane domain-containing protein [Actinomycetota bacterium]
MRALKELGPLFKYIRQNKFPLIGSIIYILLTNLAALLTPWILKLAIDSIKNFDKSAGVNNTLVKYSLLLFGIAAIGGIFKFYMRKMLVGVSRKIEYSIRKDFFSHLQGLDSSFFSNNRTGSIMALITNDLDAVRNFIGPGLLNLFSTIFIFTGFLGSAI